MITSKLTRKSQTTIPQPVRAALRLRPGDELGYVIEEGQVVLVHAASAAGDESFATFEEWSSEADRQAYDTL